MLRNIIIRIIINSAALWLVDELFDSIWFTNTNALVVTAIVFGLLNTFIKPVLLLFTLPVNILTLGLFTLIINAFILKVADYWIDDFFINGFTNAIFASIIISITSIILNNIFKDKK